MTAIRMPPQSILSRSREGKKKRSGAFDFSQPIFDHGNDLFQKTLRILQGGTSGDYRFVRQHAQHFGGAAKAITLNHQVWIGAGALGQLVNVKPEETPQFIHCRLESAQNIEARRLIQKSMRILGVRSQGAAIQLRLHVVQLLGGGAYARQSLVHYFLVLFKPVKRTFSLPSSS